MQRATARTETKRTSPRLVFPTPTSKFLGAFSVLLGVGIVALVVFIWTAQAINLNTLLNSSQVPFANARNKSSSDPNADLAVFERNTRDLANTNTPEAFQSLLQSLKQSEPMLQRSYLLNALKDASPTVVPVLITALNDGDNGVRAGAAQVLGMRREGSAIAALTGATRDPDASVRHEAVTALGSLGAIQALPRLAQLQVDETNFAVRQAAIAAADSFKREIAQAIGIPPSELRDLSVTAGDGPQIYAVTTSNLYALDGLASWTLISHLPDVPLAIATGADPKVIYLAGETSGLYRSLDGGETWEHVQFGMQTLTQMTVTAVVVDPQDSRQIFIALAAQSATSGVKNPLGIFTNTDGGSDWSFLPDSPTSLITTQLVIDPQQPGYLFGMTSDTPWRYQLPDEGCDYCQN